MLDSSLRKSAITTALLVSAIAAQGCDFKKDESQIAKEGAKTAKDAGQTTKDAAQIDRGATTAAADNNSLETVKKNIAEKKAVLVDVREQKEWDKGHIEGAVFLPLSAIRNDADAEAQAKHLPKDKIIYTHCVVGKRATAAGNILEKLGYDVRPLKQGYKELVEAGFKPAEDGQ